MTTPSIDTMHNPASFRPLLLALSPWWRDTANVIRCGDGNLSAEVGTNNGGEGQERLDVQADALFRHVPARCRAAVVCPDCFLEFAFNASSYCPWPRPIRGCIDACLAGIDGPRATSTCGVASPVAEAHRSLMRGSIFLYPANGRKGFENGWLWMFYDGVPILDATITNLHGRTPAAFGSAEKVDRIAACHDLPDTKVSSLFGHRGLFRA